MKYYQYMNLVKQKVDHIDWKNINNKTLGIFSDADGNEYCIILGVLRFSGNEAPYFRNFEKIRHLKCVNIGFGTYNSSNSSASITTTGRNVPNTIFGMVQNAAFDKIDEMGINPELVAFSVSKKPTDNTPVEYDKRVKLYDKMANARWSKKFNYPLVYANIHGPLSNSVIMSKVDLSEEDLTDLQTYLYDSGQTLK